MRNPKLTVQKKVPPGQILSKTFPVLSATDPPEIDLKDFRFRVFGAVEKPYSMSWEELMALPHERKVIDIDCVTHWSRIGDEWEGIPIKGILEKASPRGSFVMEHADSVGYTTNIPMERATADGAMLVFGFNGKPLEPDHGGPLRAIIPGLYLWKSAKWIDGLEVMTEDKPGFWEKRGYNMHGDPWKEERYWDVKEGVSSILKRVLDVRQHKDKGSKEQQ